MNTKYLRMLYTFLTERGLWEEYKMLVKVSGMWYKEPDPRFFICGIFVWNKEVWINVHNDWTNLLDKETKNV